MTPCAAVVNLRSRTGKESLAKAEIALRNAGAKLAFCEGFATQDQLDSLAERALRQGAVRLVAGGGDGTMGPVAEICLEKGLQLGLLPLGTANSYARELNIPLRLEDAARCAISPHVRMLDVGRIPHRHFVHQLSLGLSTRISSALRKQDKRRLGRLVYVQALYRGWTDHRPFDLTLKAPEMEWQGWALQVVLAVGRTHAGPFPVAPDASMDSGELAGYLVPAAGQAALMKLAWQLAAGGTAWPSVVPRLRGTTFHLHASPAVKVVADGDFSDYTPVTVECLPRALPVACPE